MLISTGEHFMTIWMPGAYTTTVLFKASEFEQGMPQITNQFMSPRVRDIRTQTQRHTFIKSAIYTKTCLKRPLKEDQKEGFQDQ